jgi:hypothetical protein
MTWSQSKKIQRWVPRRFPKRYRNFKTDQKDKTQEKHNSQVKKIKQGKIHVKTDKEDKEYKIHTRKKGSSGRTK